MPSIVLKICPAIVYYLANLPIGTQGKKEVWDDSHLSAELNLSLYGQKSVMNLSYYYFSFVRELLRRRNAR